MQKPGGSRRRLDAHRRHFSTVFCFRKNALIENNSKKINPPKDDDENEEPVQLDKDPGNTPQQDDPENLRNNENEKENKGKLQENNHI